MLGGGRFHIAFGFAVNWKDKNMLRSTILKSAVIGLGLVGIASQASAATIYTTSFDAPAFGPGVALSGQNGWVGFTNAGIAGSNVPLAGTFSYTPVPTNPQYALLTVINNATNSSGFYNPTHPSYTYTGANDKAVAVTFSMNVLAGYSAAAATDEFFGISAFGAPTGTGEIASLGINNRTGAYVLPAGATVINASPSGLGAPGLGTYRGYELLMNFATQTWSIYSQVVPNPALPYTLDAFGTFVNPTNKFTDADLAAFNLGSGASNGYAQFDDYTVQTLVPEPTSLAVAGVASGLLLARRRRSM